MAELYSMYSHHTPDALVFNNYLTIDPYKEIFRYLHHDQREVE